MSSIQNGAAPPAMNGAHPPQIQQSIRQVSDEQFQQWLVVAGNPALMEHFLNELDGGQLAEWVYFSRPDYLERLQKFQHPLIAGKVGAPAIIEAYRNTPEVWQHVRGKEQEFGRFIDEFCAWTPEVEPEDPGVIPAKAEPADEWEEGRPS